MINIKETLNNLQILFDRVDDACCHGVSCDECKLDRDTDSTCFSAKCDGYLNDLFRKESSGGLDMGDVHKMNCILEYLERINDECCHSVDCEDCKITASDESNCLMEDVKDQLLEIKDNILGNTPDILLDDIEVDMPNPPLKQLSTLPELLASMDKLGLTNLKSQCGDYEIFINRKYL